MNADKAADDAETLKEARDSANKLEASLPKRVQAAAFTQRCKLPFKAHLIRELLIHRTAALASPAIRLFEEDRVIPAVILTRAIVEALAMLFALHEQLERFLKATAKDNYKLDEFLMCCLIGSRNNPDPDRPDAI